MSTLPAKYRPWVRGVADYGPLVLFALAYFLRLRFGHDAAGWHFEMLGKGPRDLLAPTWWLLGGSVAGLLIAGIAERRIAPLPAIAGGFALVFGGLALIFHDPRFIQMKPTFSNLAFAVALFLGLAFRRNPLRLMLGEAVHMPDAAWRTLTLRYALYFLAAAILNEVIWRTQSQDIWVWFKFPGLTILTVLFSATQAPFLMKHMQDPPDADEIAEAAEKARTEA